jgi:hypothetical protein
MQEILWPEGYLPASTDNYVSNEVIVASLRAADVWPFLNETTAWPTDYGKASEIRFHDGSGPELSASARFRFTTFGFTVEAEVTECEPSAAGKPGPGSLAWLGRGRRGFAAGRSSRLAPRGLAWKSSAGPPPRDPDRKAGSGVGENQTQFHAQCPPGVAGRKSAARLRAWDAEIGRAGSPRGCGLRNFRTHPERTILSCAACERITPASMTDKAALFT